MTKYHRRAGEAGEPPYDLRITPESAGWGYSGLDVLRLPPGGAYQRPTGDTELVVLPLEGACTVEVTTAEGATHTFHLSGRSGVFAGVSDFAYVPRDAELRVSSTDGGRFAFPNARCSRRLEPRYRAASDVPVELRGAGACSRQVNNFCSADSFAADKLITVEVLTPAGNWSSYPPHKHDEASEHETELEEVYYFEVSGPVAPDGAPLSAVGAAAPTAPTAYQRVYGTADRPIDVLAEVRGGDVVLIPHGWHGPSMAAPGHHLYYLNVMAGPGEERAWRICDDPAHTWVRGTWEGQPVDPRLPLTGVEKGR